MNNSAIVLTNRFGKEYSYFAESIINAIAKEHKHKKMVTHTSFNVCLFSFKIRPIKENGRDKTPIISKSTKLSSIF